MEVTLMSLWRNDTQRDIMRRVSHLHNKVGVDHWLWVVGDSTDGTEECLLNYAEYDQRIEVHRHDTGLTGRGALESRRRLSLTASKMFEHLTGDFACLHESDLISPRDVIAQLDRSGKYPIAGWPIIRFDDLDVRFYDIWAFRDLKGTPFSARQVHGDAPFRVASFGSCWQAPVELLKGRKLEHDAVLELCQQWRREGVDLWVDPTVIVEQPISLWSPA